MSHHSPVYDLADAFVSEYAAADPAWATAVGVRGHDHEMTDFGPDAVEQRVALVQRTLATLRALPRDTDRDRVAAAVMEERLDTELALHDAAEDLRDIRVIASPIQEVRSCFDLMAYDTEDDWSVAAQRLAAVPHALASLRERFEAGRRRGLLAARRQVDACAEQCATWGGEHGEDQPFFVQLVDDHERRFGESALHRTLVVHARAATDGYAAFARYLRDEYAPDAVAADAVGAERYALNARAYCGAELDLVDTYQWGWDELGRIETSMRACADRIVPGGSIAEAADHLERDPARAIEGVDEFRAWNQDLIDETIAQLHGTHFDIPEPVRTCQAMIAPPGGAAAMYYTSPSEDFSRPGRTWYPTLGHTRFPLWREVSTCYHEAAPGHHLQIAQVVYLADVLSRFQRTSFVSGHGEGWALYAERLMGELGYLDDPAYELGMLAAQAMRAVRVIVDIGMHLELAIPGDADYQPGERWTPELALPFVIERSRQPADFMRSEVDRYLGWPGQAISYKVGERVWLEARADARARHGADFDLAAFHSYALDLGSMGLDPLRTELARF
ncbi:MAG TPA: DUF885 domain-containing protein [Acidimicrobiia bacterium]|nr:DUF885 domain-containing protein [Acidimicrobiia bacterium]